MHVIGTVETFDNPIACSARRYNRAGQLTGIIKEVQTENLLTVYVNDILTMQVGCSASNLVELVVGRLFTEGLIAGIDEIDALSICEKSMRADVILKNRTADLSKEALGFVPTCCTNNRVANRYFVRDEGLRALVPIPWSADEIFAMADTFAEDHTSHARTRGSHSAYLWRAGECLVLREDIGRHNAFDKVVGWALTQGVDLGQCALFTSGRVPTDMVTKAIRARIPILVSKAVATDKTVEIARDYALTLICGADSEKIEVFNDPGAGEHTRSMSA